jgi:hypothetical protein
MADRQLGPTQVNVTGGDHSVNITATRVLKTIPGSLLGIFVASASSTPTIAIFDNSAASGAVLVNTFTPIGGTWYPLPFYFNTGLTVSTGGTLDCTVSFT